MWNRIASLVSKGRSVIRENRKSRARSPRWDDVRDSFLCANPACAACGGTFMLQVHHVVPFHVEAGLELEETNLLTLCMGEFDCHLKLGHGGSFRHYNPQVREHAVSFLNSSPGRRLALLKEAKKHRVRD